MTVVRRKDFELTWEGIGETVSSWFRPQVRYGGSCGGMMVLVLLMAAAVVGWMGMAITTKALPHASGVLVRFFVRCACLFSDKPSLSLSFARESCTSLWQANPDVPRGTCLGVPVATGTAPSLPLPFPPTLPSSFYPSPRILPPRSASCEFLRSLPRACIVQSIFVRTRVRSAKARVHALVLPSLLLMEGTAERARWQPTGGAGA